jgi:dTDP-4-dehydrorhamnose reductase
MALLCADVFNYNKNLITPIEHFKQKAIRPKNAGLDISKLKNELGSDLKILNLKSTNQHIPLLTQTNCLIWQMFRH